MKYESDNFKLVCQACLSRDIEIKLCDMSYDEVDVIISCNACANKETIRP